MKLALVSACLLGLKTKYNGEDNYREDLIELLSEYILIPVCPEQLGGLSTPRERAEIKNGKVITISDKDVSYYFIKGANEVLKIAQLYNIKYAFFKAYSPSCGFGKIYDGSFSGRLTNGNGIAAKLLSENGIEIIPIE